MRHIPNVFKDETTVLPIISWAMLVMRSVQPRVYEETMKSVNKIKPVKLTGSLEER